MAQIGRNEPCCCGSGKKYKHCCGNLAVGLGEEAVAKQGMHTSPVNLAVMNKQALALQASGQLSEAADLYGIVLLHAPKNFDALHMLGVIHAQRGRPREALRLMLEAASVEEGTPPPLFDNLGRALVLAAEESGGIEMLLCPDLVLKDMPLRVFADDLPAPFTTQVPLVSIVIPCFNHESYVVEALRSVYAQTYPNIEIIIIDDGSRDRSVEMVKGVLEESPYPVKLVVRENRGAHVTLNEGADLASGSYIGILNSDDRYLPYRVDSLVRMLTVTGKGWGFSGVKFIDSEGGGLKYGQNGDADNMMRGLDTLYSASSITFGFGRFNYAISTGNLFFSKALWKQLGGFSGYRYVHDYDFCLRALLHEAPAVLHEPAYEYRLHGKNTIEESREWARSEATEMLQAWGRDNNQLHRNSELSEHLVPSARDCAFLTTDRGHLIDQQRLIEMAQRFIGRSVSEAR